MGLTLLRLILFVCMFLSLLLTAQHSQGAPVWKPKSVSSSSLLGVGALSVQYTSHIYVDSGLGCC